MVKAEKVQGKRKRIEEENDEDRGTFCLACSAAGFTELIVLL